MNIKEVFEAFDYRITSGSDFEWFCWPNARSVDFSKSNNMDVYGSVTYKAYDAETIYEVTLENSDQLYRWVNPKYSKEYFDEYVERGLDPHVLYDDVKWVDLTENELLSKVKELFESNSKPVDNRVDVDLELEDEVFMQLAMEAHKRDITLNQMVELILKNAILEHESKSDIEHSKHWYDTERNK